MAKLRRRPNGPPPGAKKWLEKYKQRKQRGRTPTPEHFQSIWDASYIPDDYTPATSEMIAKTEARLEIVIPETMKGQLLVQNGGRLLECDQYPFKDASVHWTNATVDGIHKVQSWQRAKDNNWFESVEDVKGLDLLIVVAAHSESQLCFDYRKSGINGMPAVTFVDVCMNPIEIRIIAKTVDEFILALIALRGMIS